MPKIAVSCHPKRGAKSWGCSCPNETQVRARKGQRAKKEKRKKIIEKKMRGGIGRRLQKKVCYVSHRLAVEAWTVDGRREAVS